MFSAKIGILLKLGFISRCVSPFAARHQLLHCVCVVLNHSLSVKIDSNWRTLNWHTASSYNEFAMLFRFFFCYKINVNTFWVRVSCALFMCVLLMFYRRCRSLHVRCCFSARSNVQQIANKRNLNIDHSRVNAYIFYAIFIAIVSRMGASALIVSAWFCVSHISLQNVRALSWCNVFSKNIYTRHKSMQIARMCISMCRFYYDAHLCVQVSVPARTNRHISSGILITPEALFLFKNFCIFYFLLLFLYWRRGNRWLVFFVLWNSFGENKDFRYKMNFPSWQKKRDVILTLSQWT